MNELGIDEALASPRLLGAALGPLDSWMVWSVALKAAFGLPLDELDRRIFRAIAGDRDLPKRRVQELWAVAGRRSGKSRVAAAIAIYLALFVKHKLAPGEKGMVLVIAGTTDQAGVVFDYMRGFIEASPALAREVRAFKQREIVLGNGIVIGVHSNSFRHVRGRTAVAIVFDEVSFWRDESTATPDREVYSAVKPMLSTTGGVLIGISTPYRKLGLLHAKWRDHFGVDANDILVVQGTTRMFNPTLADTAIAEQRLADPTAADAEWDAMFRSDIGAFLDDEMIDRAIDHGRPLELPRRAGVIYFAFVDASGGATGGDSYTLCIGHREGNLCVIDVVRGTVSQFDPYETTQEYAALCTEYGIHTVTGDAYGREWVAGAWRKAGKSYNKSERVKAEIYMESMPTWTRGLVRIPDHARLVRELRLLERRTHRSGKDTIEHPKNGRDDYANVVCGVINLLTPTRPARAPAPPIVAPFAGPVINPFTEAFRPAW
jgi:Terminase large subunit, T4likevirus-type, N-terminal